MKHTNGRWSTVLRPILTVCMNYIKPRNLCSNRIWPVQQIQHSTTHFHSPNVIAMCIFMCCLPRKWCSHAECLNTFERNTSKIDNRLAHMCVELTINLKSMATLRYWMFARINQQIFVCHWNCPVMRSKLMPNTNQLNWCCLETNDCSFHLLFFSSQQSWSIVNWKGDCVGLHQ